MLYLNFHTEFSYEIWVELHKSIIQNLIIDVVFLTNRADIENISVWKHSRAKLWFATQCNFIAQFKIMTRAEKHLLNVIWRICHIRGNLIIFSTILLIKYELEHTKQCDYLSRYVIWKSLITTQSSYVIRQNTKRAVNAVLCFQNVRCEVETT